MGNPPLTKSGILNYDRLAYAAHEPLVGVIESR